MNEDTMPLSAQDYHKIIKKLTKKYKLGFGTGFGGTGFAPANLILNPRNFYYPD